MARGRKVAVTCVSAVLLTLALVYSQHGGERSILDENGSDVHGGAALETKDNMALSLLSNIMSKHAEHKKAALKRLAVKSPGSSQHRGRGAGGIPPMPSAPHIMGALPGQGGPDGAPPPNPVAEGLQSIMGGWTGAGWWQPCSEVCTAGRSRAEMKVAETFKQFQACESHCRGKKAAQLKSVIGHVKAMVKAEGGNPNQPAFDRGPPGGPGGGPGGPG
eukprot:CAMPEP_0180289770 /NCGR_PEP_ID=MMETSP0988-20121125/14958_1 /TAXON_ID=697907 /ORGANISM="non described non described, Strain CCMP2293" /LENGTH=217 /DNA_ID=CAMNT_0022264935 /DNA_START=61 /DNA_END=710 /DNA_ORIENTATION=-